MRFYASEKAYVLPSPNADNVSLTADIAAAAFDRVLRRHGRLDPRPEQPADLAFIRLLFARCSPLAETLPPALLTGQADLQEIGHRAQHPDAMRRILWRDARPIGRVVIDWSSAGGCQCVDIAVLPEHRGSGAGIATLRAWLEVADHDRRTCRLEVLRANPAALLYRRLGFTALGATGAHDPVMTMIRPPRAAP